MEQTEAQKRAKAKYKKEKVKTMLLEFYPTDLDIIEHLDNQPRNTKQTYIKALIRADIKKEQE
jgi:hypothetical protein